MMLFSFLSKYSVLLYLDLRGERKRTWEGEERFREDPHRDLISFLYKVALAPSKTSRHHIILMFLSSHFIMQQKYSCV